MFAIGFWLLDKWNLIILKLLLDVIIQQGDRQMITSALEQADKPEGLYSNYMGLMNRTTHLWIFYFFIDFLYGKNIN